MPYCAKYLQKLAVGYKEAAHTSSPIELDVVSLPQEAGSFPMELEFPMKLEFSHQDYSGNSTVRTYIGMWFVCTAEEVV